MEAKMPADDQQVYTAAEILRHIDDLVAFQQDGILDVREGIYNALDAFNQARCESLADALAFIAMSRRLTQATLRDIVVGLSPCIDSAEAADRYMAMAIAFIREKEAQERYSQVAGLTLH